MRKLRRPLLLILLMAIGGIVLAFSYEAPEFKIFIFNQHLDEEITHAELKIDKTREEILNHLQATLAELIEEGQTIDETTNLSEQFQVFEEYYQSLQDYVEIVIPAMNKTFENADFEEVVNTIGSLSEDDQPLGREMLTFQQERVDYLQAINNQMEELSEMLADFEAMFNTTDRPSQPIIYFQTIAKIFEEIESLHSNYVISTESYHLAKTNYYLILMEMGLFEYFFGR